MAEFPASSPAMEGMAELRHRLLQIVLPGSVLCGLLLTYAGEVEPYDLRVSVLGSWLAVLPFAAWLVMARSRPLGHWVVGLGYVGLAAVSGYWLTPEALAALLPVSLGVTALLLGRRYRLAMAGAASVLILAGGSPLTGLAVRLVAVIGVWAVQGLVQATLGYALEAIEESSAGYQAMRKLLEEARNQRLELKKTQGDLLLANKELARVSERLDAMRRVAEEARRAKEEFVASVSHELRTPLNMILGFSEIITRAPQTYGGQLPAKLLADIGTIRSSGQHLAALIDDVLDLSQIDAGRMALTRQWASVGEIIDAAVSAVTPLFESRGLYLEKDVPAGLPALFCDRTRIRQVVLNLLSNAGRYTERGGARVQARLDGANLLVTVADTGPGISPEDQECIFEPFARTSAAQHSGGSGLGLTISKRFVELHGGRMWLESAPGTGTAFHFSLPVEAPSPPVAEDFARWFRVEQEYQPRARPSQPLRSPLNPRFVIVETGDVLRRLFARYHDEVEIVSTRSVAEAIREARRVPAQALIVNEPTLRQPAAAALTADLPYGTPMVLCSLADRKEVAERLGLVGYLVKPIDLEQLLAALDALPQPVRTVLVADDELEAQQLLSRMLAASRRGYRVLRATTGRRTLSLLRERRPDVLLLDLVMPGIDGYELLRQKSQDPDISPIPTLAVTAQDPAQGPLVTNLLVVTRNGGLQVREVLAFIEAIAEILSPPDRLEGTRRE